MHRVSNLLRCRLLSQRSLLRRTVALHALNGLTRHVLQCRQWVLLRMALGHSLRARPSVVTADVMSSRMSVLTQPQSVLLRQTCSL